MPQYLVLIHGNARTTPSATEWEQFFTAAQRSGLFRGGSEIGDRTVVGDAGSRESTDHIVGFMRFDTEDEQSLLDLLNNHPVVLHGGSIECCEMPKHAA